MGIGTGSFVKTAAASFILAGTGNSPGDDFRIVSEAAAIEQDRVVTRQGTGSF
jgi:hypothetical protein